MQRKSYDTSIKNLSRFGLQNAIPLELRQDISRTNIHRWKNEDDSRYVGTQLNNIAKQELELLTEFANSKRAKQLFRASIRITKTLQSLLSTGIIETTFRLRKEEIVNLAERVKTVFPLNNL